MGRPLKVTPLEVLEKIKYEGSTTKLELAREFKVCGATIGNRLKDLRNDSEPVLFDVDGLFILEGIENITDLNRLEKYRDWIMKTLIGVLKCSKPVKPLSIQAKEKFKELTTKDERREFRKFFLQMEKMVDYLEIEEED